MHESGFDIVGVITAPDKPAGRGQKIQQSAVKITAEQLGLEIYQPVNLKSEACQEQLKRWSPDLGVVIAFRMLPVSVWNFPPLGTINLHASLLPNYRGAAPIQHVLINGESKTGVTTFFLKHEIDTGDIIDQAELIIKETTNAGELHDQLMDLGSHIMIETLRKIEIFGKNTPTTPQELPSDGLKMAPKLSREFCELNLDSTPEVLLNKIRGLSPYPAAWVKSPWGDMKVFNAKKTDHLQDTRGFQIQNKRLYLGCAMGSIELLQIQIPGKSKMNSSDFINGLPKKD